LDSLSDSSIVDADDEVTRSIKEHTISAVRRLGLLIQSDDDSVACRASAEVLDRGGYPKTQRSEVKSLSVVVTAADAKRIADTLDMERLARKEAG
jgi:hypothetical protein